MILHITPSAAIAAAAAATLTVHLAIPAAAVLA
jgi:hypothetical protein